MHGAGPVCDPRITAMPITLASKRYQAVVSRDPELIRACQELRQHVFSTEFGTDSDIDEFDELCTHLAVLDAGEVVGTYRLLLPGSSSRLYSQSEFAVDALDDLRPDLVEIGRSC